MGGILLKENRKTICTRSRWLTIKCWCCQETSQWICLCMFVGVGVCVCVFVFVSFCVFVWMPHDLSTKTFQRNRVQSTSLHIVHVWCQGGSESGAVYRSVERRSVLATFLPQSIYGLKSSYYWFLCACTVRVYICMYRCAWRTECMWHRCAGAHAFDSCVCTICSHKKITSRSAS